MASRNLTDELVSEIADDLRQRYAMDGDDLRELGTRLAGTDRTGRSNENAAFAEKVLAEHPATIKRLGE